MQAWLRKSVSYVTAIAVLQSALASTVWALPLASVRAPEQPVTLDVGSAPTPLSDYRLAFDGRADTSFVSDQKTIVEYVLAGGQQNIQSLRVLDAAPFVLTVEYWNGNSWSSVPAWLGLDLSQQPGGWQEFVLKQAVLTDRFRLTLEPRNSASAGLKEIEFWTADGADALASGVSATTAALDSTAATPPAPLRQYLATPQQAQIGSAGTAAATAAGGNQFHVTLDADPTAIKHAWLAYDVYGVQDHSAVTRSVNDQLAVGGYFIQKTTAWATQKEAIDPAWLRAGDNIVQFGIPDGASYSYQIRNLRLITETHTGTQLIAGLRASGGAASTIAMAFDGRTDTGVTLASLRGAVAAAKPAWQQANYTSHELLPGCPANYCRDNLAEGTVEVSLDGLTQAEQFSFFIQGHGYANADLQMLGAGNSWAPVPGSYRVQTGWNTISLRSQSALRALRLHFDRQPQQLTLGEVRIQGGQVQGAWSRNLVLSAPLAGQYYGNQGYLKGFVVGEGADQAQLLVASQAVTLQHGEFEAIVQKPASAGTSWSVPVTAIFPDGQVAQQQVQFTTPEQADYQRPISQPGATASTTAGAGQAALLSQAGATIEVLPGAVKDKKQLSITPLRDVDLPALDAGLVNVTKNYSGYRFLPHGKFQSKIKVHLPYDKSKLPAGYTEADIKTYFFDEATGRWVPLDTADINVGKNEVVAYTDHFTDMINGVLQVPDNPETQAYAPTQMKDIKAADPGAGINLIDAPQATAMGDANLGYPIQLPPGRHGVQPGLHLGYSSGAGNGWLGQGWNLQLPAVSIDTRWGVPHYSATNETETYLLNGEQLTPLAHRDALQPRAAEKTFHTRIEGAFQRIVRHGDKPSDYWWEITSKDGTRYFYGGAPDTGLHSDAVLTDGNGNVAHWALVEERDTNDNFVRYHYIKQADSGVGSGAGGVTGYQLYVQHITYTGHGSTEGLYTVDFVRDRDLSEPRRADVSIDARLGFKQVTADLLRKVNVGFNGQPVRSYELVYGQGAFAKTLLKSVKQYAADGSLFNTHTFDYYDDVKAATGYAPFSPSVSWQTGSPDVRAGFVSNVNAFNDKASALSGNKGTSTSTHLAIAFGPDDGNLGCKSYTVGGSVGFGNANGDGVVALVDIDGDGLPDEVVETGQGLVYYKSQPQADGSNRYVGPNPIAGMDKFFRDKSRSRDFGFEATMACQPLTASFGLSHNESTSTTSTYFADVNGDGLVDIVSDGVVYFNHIAGGIPTFSPDSNLSPNPIGGGAVDSTGLVNPNAQALQQAINQNPLHDTVRVWEAPYAGTVTIMAPVQLVQDSSKARQDYGNKADGVRVAIQLKGAELWSTRIQGTDFSVKTPAGLGSIVVQKGDHIYFRVQSVFDGSYDQVSWNPVVQYANVTPTQDANNKPIYQFTAGNDFLLAAYPGQTIYMPLDGQVSVQGSFTKPATSDDVTVKLLQNNQIVWQQTLSAAQPGNIAVNQSLAVKTGDQLRLMVVADSNVDWTALTWQPSVFYTQATNPNIQVKDAQGNYQIKLKTAYELSLYNDALSVQAPQPWIAAQTNAALTVTPQLAVAGSPSGTGQVVFTVKRAGQLLAKQILSVSNGVVSGQQPISLSVTQGDALWFEYSSANVDKAKIQNASVVFGDINALPQVTTSAGYYQPRQDQRFGPMYRQWGQFAYNGNGDRANQPIVESDLHPASPSQAPNANDFSSATNAATLQQKFNQEGYDPTQTKFIMMIPDLDNAQWLGYSNLSWVRATGASSTRFGDPDLSVTSPVVSATARAIAKVVQSSTDSVSLGAGSGSATTSSGTGTATAEFMDMNGDRYPDIVAQGQVQYTTTQGALDGQATPISGFEGPRGQSTTATGITAGGSYGLSKAGPNRGVAKTVYEASQTMPSVGINGSLGTSDDNEQYGLDDVNGDGLPDRVYPDGRVALNLGYGFAAPELWSFSQQNQGHSDNQSAGLGFNLGAYSIGGGVSLSRATNQQKQTLADVNGDGLPDLVSISGSGDISVSFNTGNGFTAPLPWRGASTVVKGSSSSESISAYFTVCIPFPVPPVFKLCFNPGGSASNSMNRQEQQLVDVDGDGYPDFVSSDSASGLQVSRSTIGRTNLLKAVHRPLGATITLDYTRVGNTYAMPQSRWVMSSVTVDSGQTGNGVDRHLSTYQYKNGVYDRREREFYGFKTVVTEERDTAANDQIYRLNTADYANTTYYEKGLLLDEQLTDAAGHSFGGTANTYTLVDVNSGVELSGTDMGSLTATAFPQLSTVIKTFAEGGSQTKSTRQDYAYDSLGNVKRYVDYGDDGPGDDLIATISYFALNDRYIMSEPQSIEVRDSSSQLLRRRESTIDSLGNLTELRRYLRDGTAITHDFGYDSYGNVNLVQRPANNRGQRYSLSYQYDPTVATHVTRVTDSFGLSSSANYDLRWGDVSTSRDTNGQVISTAFDPQGRVSTITGPYQQSGHQHTLRFTYHPEAADTGGMPWALTEHEQDNQPKPLDTVLFTDGLKRVLQTKKDGAVDASGSGRPTDMMIVSGRTLFDAFGRSVSQYHPISEARGTPGVFNANFDGIAPTRTAYDVLDRELQTTLPDASVFKTAYDFGADRDGQQRFRTTHTDANGEHRERFTDVRGRETALLEHNPSGGQPTIWTSYHYDAINELTGVLDDHGNQTTADYDMLGRRTALQSPDSGREERVYDNASNLVQKISANLRAQGKAIQYDYDYERLSGIRYPQFPDNNVSYSYGRPGAACNAAGRLTEVNDASGKEQYCYGLLGETVRTDRTIVSLTGRGAKTYTTQFAYDTWNRLQSLTYPDGEVLSYHYNSGGLLDGISGKKGGNAYNYLSGLTYDVFEQRVYQTYGNGTVMHYSYEPDRRRLHELQSANSQRTFMDLSYGYDRMTNIKSLSNLAAAGTQPDNFGGPTQQSFGYDDLYRLTAADGHWTNWNGQQQRYSDRFSYDSVHNLTHKTQTDERLPGTGPWLPEKKTSYDWAYAYAGPQPHAATHIGDRSFHYDLNGNQLGWDNDDNGQRRKIVWDDEDRVRSISDNGHTDTYVYDATGERVIKRGRQGETTYVNAYFVVRNGEIASKHVFNGSQRIATQLVMQAATSIPGNTGNSANNGVGNGNIPPGWIQNDKAQNPGANFLSAQDRAAQLGSAQAFSMANGNSGSGVGGGASHTVYEFKQYFYHPDQVGSNGYVTDGSGAVYEHTEYFPFGETWVQEHSDTNNTPYLFTGKELDEDTQLYYFGARYYDPRTSQWQSTDPILDDYIGGGTNGGVFHPDNLGLYTYSYNNPVNLHDPDGKSVALEIPLLLVVAAIVVVDVTQTPAQRQALGNALMQKWHAFRESLPESERTPPPLITPVADPIPTTYVTPNDGPQGATHTGHPAEPAPVPTKYETPITPQKKEDNILTKSGGTYDRPSGYRNGVRDTAWGAAVEQSTGRVRDPKTGRFMSKSKPWDMGHGTWDMGHGTWDMGHGTWDISQATSSVSIKRVRQIEELTDSNFWMSTMTRLTTGLSCPRLTKAIVAKIKRIATLVLRLSFWSWRDYV